MTHEDLVREFPENAIFYDGDCIYCQKYTELVRLRSNIGDVKIVNLRERPDIVALFRSRGIDVDEGMVFLYGGTIHHGHRAVNALAMLSEEGGVMGAANRLIFRSKIASAVLYPFMKAGRRATLWLRGKRLIRDER